MKIEERLEPKTVYDRRHLFDRLETIKDGQFHSAAINMALDEALLEQATDPSIRFYRWNHPALSFGYFGKYLDVEIFVDHRDIVRRWTGGGIVFHGNDLTYSLVIPANHFVFARRAVSIYDTIHRAIKNALATTGQCAELATGAAVYDRQNHPGSGVADRRYSNEACFANPVRADVLVNGRKVAGAAQRRTRCGLLQQGSIQWVELSDDFEEQFAGALSTNCKPAKISGALLHRAREIAGQKYASNVWLRKR
jgi:lipoate-protein ligase A